MALKAKLFENDVINQFTKVMETYPVHISMPHQRGRAKSKKIIVNKWEESPNKIRKKPYKVMKDDFVRVAISNPALSKDILPLNRLILYVVPDKIVIGVWVCCRIERYVSDKYGNIEEPFSMNELLKCIAYLQKLESAPNKVFALYSVTGWDDSIYTNELMASEPDFIYAIKEKLDDDEIISKTDGYDIYSNLFPNVGDLPKRGIPKPKKPKVDVVHAEERVGVQADGQLSSEDLNTIAAKIAAQLQGQSGPPINSNDSPHSPTPAQPSQVQTQPILETKEEWEKYIDSIDLNKRKDLRVLAKKITLIKANKVTYWPVFKCIWQAMEEKITVGIIDEKTIESMTKAWERKGMEKNYFRIDGNLINIYVSRGRNPVGLLYYLICERMGRKFVTDSYTAKWIHDRSKDFRDDDE